jgi:cellulose synthase/poly-beta-1,6-N-acetylglucosamine synthase-like glycosyltransferase
MERTAVPNFSWALFALFLLAAIHPFVSYPLSLVVIRRWRTMPQAGSQEPACPVNLAICFCAYNEERVIQEKIANLMMLSDLEPTLEILAYVDGATDRTAELLLRQSDRITVHVSNDRRGKTYGMNLLVRNATAPIVVFTDANVMIDPAALRNLQRYFVDPQIGCVCGHLIYTNAEESATASVGSLYWRFEEWLKQAESDTGSAMGADGSMFAVRRVLHRPVPDQIFDDIYLSMSILCDGLRVVQAPDVIAFERSAPNSFEEFQRKIRIGCQAFNAHRLLWKRLHRLDALSLYKYLSHKLLRWLCFYNLLLSFIFMEVALSTVVFAGCGLAAATTAAAAAYVGAVRRVRPLAQVWEIFLAILGTGIGVWQSLRGEHYRTWTPSLSVRE